VKGTGGLLVDAKKEGIISHVAPYLDGMIQAGYFLGDSLVKACLLAAGECLDYPSPQARPQLS